MRTLQCFQKKLNLFFAHENIKKRASKVAHNRPQTFFSQYCLAAQTSPELIFHIIIDISQDKYVSLSVFLPLGFINIQLTKRGPTLVFINVPLVFMRV